MALAQARWSLPFSRGGSLAFSSSEASFLGPSMWGVSVNFQSTLR
jgi:hypothetical protein